MDYKNLIAESWSYTQKHKPLIRWFGFTPALLTTTVAIGYMAYQFFAFKTSWIFDDAENSFFHDVVTFIWDFVIANISLTLPIIIFGVIFGIMYLFYPTIAKASAIQMIARNKNGQDAGVGTGFRYGIMSFLKLFEYHILIKTFAFFSILIEMSFVVRNLGPVIFKMLLPAFILFIIISFILTLLFTFTDFFIVVDDDSVFGSMRKSARLVLLNWKHTFLISLLMLMIGFRIILQAVLVFTIPTLIVLITGYITTVALPVTSIIVGGVVGFISIILAAYLNGVVDVFSYTVWTYTFLALTQEKELSARDVFVDDIGESEREDYKGHKNL